MVRHRLILPTLALAVGFAAPISGTAQADDSPRTGGWRGGTFTAPVLRGVQIYKCTKQADGAYAYTQHDVRARLAHGIRHSFVEPTAGPPQWIAPDGSAVTGKVISRTPNGPGNIPELELEATQSGRRHGLLSRTVKIRRLNTMGGVAPSGTCDPERRPTVKVPYRADYVFVSERDAT